MLDAFRQIEIRVSTHSRLKAAGTENVKTL